MKPKLLPCQCCLKRFQADRNMDCLHHLRMIDECFSIQVPIERCSDGSLPVICSECAGKLEDCRRFMLTIQESQFALETAGVEGVKEAQPDTTKIETPHAPDSSDDDCVIFDSPTSPAPESPAKTVPTIKIFQCECCPKTFQFEENLKFHTKNHTNYTEGLYECDKCAKKFTHKTSLAFHIKTHTALEMEGDHRCEACNAVFLTLGYYKDHIIKHALEPIHNYRCIDCPQAFNTARELKYHSRRHYKTYKKCDICGLVLSVHSFSRHMDRHMGRGTNVCPVQECEERFMSMMGRLRHMSEVHGMDVDKFMCEFCPKKYPLQHLLKQHLKHNHRQAEPKTIMCDECGFLCGDARKLLAHMATHGTQLKLNCDLCKKKFLSKQNLQRHKWKEHNS